jgi:hypothetical protein
VLRSVFRNTGPRGSGRREIEEALDGGEEGFGIDGFGEVVVHAAFEATFTGMGFAEGGEGNDGCAGEVLLGFAVSEVLGCGEAVHFWHLNIEEDEVEVLVGGFIEAFLAASGGGGSELFAFEEVGQDALVEEVVIDDEDEGGWGRISRVRGGRGVWECSCGRVHGRGFSHASLCISR